MNRERSCNVLFINKEPAKLEDDTECASLPKLTKLVKKLSNLTKIGKKKPQCPISHSLTHFIEPIEQPCFCFAKGLMGLTDSLAMSGAKLREEEVVVGFSG